MRVLLFCNDRHHPGQVPIDGIKPLCEKGFVFDIITDATNFDPAILSSYDAIIMSKNDNISDTNHDSWKTDAVQEALIKYVENGGGLLVTHNGTIAGENTDKLNRLVGSRFIRHPARCPLTVAPIKPHPVTSCVEPYCEVDEHYYMEILADDIDIIAAAYVAEHIEPCVYVRTQGKGRVCVITPGHLLEAWLNPQFQLLLENGLRWCVNLPDTSVVR